MKNKPFNDTTLIIPKGLHDYKRVDQLFKYDKNSTILYKSINQDLINIEFYTQSYCIVFNLNGVETITSYDFQEVVIKENDLLFLHKDMYLISDFTKKDKKLEAFLFFFDDDIVDKFLSMKKLKKEIINKKVSFYKLDTNEAINKYIQSLKEISKDQFDSTHFLNLKLLELLFIIDSNDKENRLVNSFLSRNIDKDKRNIKSLMKQHFLSNLTLEDYALLSGRSLSTFHRDFKKHNKITPKQYLLNLKLKYAHKELQNQTKWVSEIACELGYKNTSHFIQAFKKRYNITPKQLSKNSL